MRKLFLILLIYFLSFNLVVADTKIAFIDLDRVISTSKPGSHILEQLNEFNLKNSDKLKNDAKILKEKEVKLISQKNILSEKDFQLNVNELKLEIKNYNNITNKIKKNFAKLEIDNTNKLIKLINPILIKYSDEQSIAIVFQKKNLIIGKSDLDITDEIIKIIDVEIQKFKIQ